jgi:UDP-N-acetylmuramoyl-tripeptide--D-alanyl-D-alanine ligase
MFSKNFIRRVLTVSEPLPKKFDRVWTDSRSAQKGDLFAAIPGEKFDGHDFILSAAKRGALGAIVCKKKFPGRDQLPESFALLHVRDTTEALRSLAKAYRAQLKIPIFAVAGSNGKTTTKEWVGFLLQKIHGKGRVYKTEKSQNSILGIALSLLQIRKEKVAVIEIGIDEPGWMDQHLEVVAPTHGLITTIAEEHLNRLKNLETIAREELKLLKFLVRTRGAFAANQDSVWINNHSLPKNSLTYGLDQPAQIEGLFESPQILHAFGIQWKNPLPGKHNAQNLLAAITALRLLHPDLTQEDFLKLSKTCVDFQGEAHRSRLIEISNEIRIFDDCYNANPDSMERALQAFLEVSNGCRQHAILGDMFDLGASSKSAHQRILNLAIVLGLNHIYLLGDEFGTVLKKMVNPPSAVRHFGSIEELTKAVQKNLRPTDFVLIKGSRGMAMERALKYFS